MAISDITNNRTNDKDNNSNNNGTLTRRRFLHLTGSVAAGVVAAGTIGGSSSKAWAGMAAQNSPRAINVGCIGLGGRGSYNMRAFMVHGAHVRAVCDVDAAHLEPARKRAGLDKKSAYNDYRNLLERKDIDAVVISTPDHWHVPVALAAVRAGKDVYCEKPLTLTIAEGRLLCNEVKRYGRVFQVGSQQRSDALFRHACELALNGRLGKLQNILVEIPPNSRDNPLNWQPMPVPKGFDYDLWLGRACEAPYTKMRCHYSFRFIFDYSGGQITNWGAHMLDIAQWGNGSDHSGPSRIIGKGVFPADGLFNTALNVDVQYFYDNGVRLHCITSDNNPGVRFEGTKGWVHVRRGRIEAQPKSLVQEVFRPDEIHLYRSKDHYQNFLDCIRSRREPVASVEIGHRSATMCHLGNIAMRLGRELYWDPQKERFIGDEQANRMLTRPRRSPWVI